MEETMNIEEVKKGALTRTVNKTFGKGTPYVRFGKYAHVFMNGASEENMKETSESFEPTDFFDKGCPHCEPFLQNGAIMVHSEGDSLIGMRMLPGGMFETVILTAPRGALGDAAVN